MTESWNIRDSREIGKVAHPSTYGALQALQQIQSVNVTNILDVGCGSGLLAMLAARQWPKAKVLGADISKTAVDEIQHNIAENGFSAQITAIRAEGLDHAEITARAPYGLIIANLVADLHMRYAARMGEAVVRDGLLILSGLQTWQVPQIAELYQSLGFELPDEIQMESWVTLVAQYRT